MDDGRRDLTARATSGRAAPTSAHVTAGRRTTRRRVAARTVAAGALIAVAALAAACTPPTQPAPGVVVPGPDRGRDPSVDVAPSAGCATGEALPAGRTVVTVEVDGAHRVSLLDVPTAPSDEPRPVLVSLHPFLVGPEGWDGYSGLAAAATERGYVVLTPLGSDPGPRWAVPGGLQSEARDLEFIGALLDHVEDNGCVDRNRETAAGFSAGAAMAQALSCTMPGRIAAAAGSGGVNLTDLCPDSPGTSMLILHGTADPIAPPSGSEVEFAPPLGLSVDSVAATDAARAGCAPEPTIDQPFPSVRRSTWTGCSDDRRVQRLDMLGAGHTWAGSTNPLLEIVTGPTNTDISATSTVLDFFDGV